MSLGPNKFEFINPDEIPKWITFSAMWVCENYAWLWFYQTSGECWDFEKNNDPEINKIADQNLNGLMQCLKSLAMKEVWLKINKLICPDSSEKSQFWFTNAILRSFYHPRSSALTESKTISWKLSTLGKLEKALDAINELPETLPSFHKNYKKVRNNRNNNWPNHSSNTSEVMKVLLEIGVDHPRSVLRDAITALEQTEFYPGYLGKHVKGVNAIRQYFVRSLTAFLINKNGKKNRKIVALTASAAFDSDITAREILRLTKSSNPESIHSANVLVAQLLSEKFLIREYERCMIDKKSWESSKK